VRVPVQHGDGLSSLQTPNTDQLVAASRREKSVVEAAGNVGDLSSVTAKGAQEPTVDGTPHFDEIIIRSRYDIFAGAVKGDAVDG